jgi:hypothetical protein
MAASPPTLDRCVLIGASAFGTAVAAVGAALVVVGQMELNAMGRQWQMLRSTFRLEAENSASPLPAVAGQ